MFLFPSPTAAKTATDKNKVYIALWQTCSWRKHTELLISVGVKSLIKSWFTVKSTINNKNKINLGFYFLLTNSKTVTNWDNYLMWSMKLKCLHHYLPYSLLQYFDSLIHLDRCLNETMQRVLYTLQNLAVSMIYTTNNNFVLYLLIFNVIFCKRS